MLCHRDYRFEGVVADEKGTWSRSIKLMTKVSKVSKQGSATKKWAGQFPGFQNRVS